MAEYSREGLTKMYVPDIKDIMRAKGITPLTGNKAVLIDRLMEALEGQHFVETKLPVSSFSDHLTKAQKSQVLKRPAGTDYKLKRLKDEINKLAESEDLEDLNSAIEKVRGYTGFDKSRLIAFIMQRNFELGNSVEDCLAVLNVIINYEERLSYDELYDYLMPFFMGILRAQMDTETEEEVLTSLQQMINDGLTFNTVIIAMARTNRFEMIQSLRSSIDIPYEEISRILANEITYLMTIANLDRLDRDL